GQRHPLSTLCSHACSIQCFFINVILLLDSLFSRMPLLSTSSFSWTLCSHPCHSMPCTPCVFINVISFWTLCSHACPPDNHHHIQTSNLTHTHASHRYADACVQSVDDRRAFSYAFLYPPRFARTVTNDPSSSITERNTRPVMVNGKATTYAQCGGLQSQGNEACKVLPEYSSDPKKLVRYQCINAN
ncbi:hypothetical protein BC829DRAFT_381324, partial [Chytridium lagenaria]